LQKKEDEGKVRKEIKIVKNEEFFIVATEEKEL